MKEKLNLIDVIIKDVILSTKSVEFLDEVASKTKDNKILCNICLNDNVSLDTLKKIVDKTKNIKVLNAVAMFTSDLELLRVIFNKTKNKEVLKAIASFNNKVVIDSELLDNIVDNSKDGSVLRAVVENPNVSNETLNKIFLLLKNKKIGFEDREDKNLFSKLLKEKLEIL